MESLTGGLRARGKAGKAIEDITGLQYAINLKWLELDWNEISNLAPLKGLNGLEELYLSNNRIAGLAPLSELSNLVTLDLRNNYLDITPPAAHHGYY